MPRPPYRKHDTADACDRAKRRFDAIAITIGLIGGLCLLAAGILFG